MKRAEIAENERQNRRQKLVKELVEFVGMSFEELNPDTEYLHNWHIDEMCESLVGVYLEEADKKRLIINLPPRHLKSLCTSVAFPAWVLGKSPGKRIIISSYSGEISGKHFRDSRRIMESDWYKKKFPNLIKARRNERNKFITTRSGFYYATSNGGTLTGEGGDILIVDDPQKPMTIHNQTSRMRVVEWFENTFSPRLNDRKKGAIIVTMQRLHEDDLTGALLQKSDKWKVMETPLIATKDEKYRKMGEVIHPARYGMEEVLLLRSDMSTKAFETQYQQNPIGNRGGFFNREWFREVEDFERKEGDIIVVSVDSASKLEERHDYTGITAWAIRENQLFCFKAIKEKLDFGSLLTTVKDLISDIMPNFALIEDKSSGIGLIQELSKLKLGKTRITPIKPKYSKLCRFLDFVYYFELGRVTFSKKIAILGEMQSEILSFPNVKHDDIVDSIVNFLLWYNSSFESKIQTIFHHTFPRFRSV